MTRSEKILEARRLRDFGWTAPAIGRELGVNESTVRNWYLGGTCDCGALITYNSTLHETERCLDCQVALAHEEKFWTKERVLDAIHRYAATHGRYPTANEWIKTDPVNDYPSRNSVYRANPRSTSPFASWHDALAAAGFPGATPGRRTYKEVHGMATPSRHGYVVLHETTEGLWEVVSKSNEGTQLAALNASLNGTTPNGRWLAIPGMSWRPRELRPRTIFDWAEEVEASPVA